MYVYTHTRARAGGVQERPSALPSRTYPAGRQGGPRFTTYGIDLLWLNSSRCGSYRRGGCGRGAEGPPCTPRSRACVYVCVHIHLWYTFAYTYIYKTSFVNNILINNERWLKPPTRYSGQWPWQHRSRSRLLGLGPLFGIFTVNIYV